MSDKEEQPLGVSNDNIEDPPINLLTEALNSELLDDTEGCDDFQKKCLEGLEFPFNWKLSDITISDDIVISEVRDKLDHLSYESVDFDQFNWYRFTLELLLAYLLTNNGEYTEAFECLDKCDQILQELEDEHCEEPLFTKIKEALWHVNIASRIYTLLKSDSGNNESVKELLGKIPKFTAMTDVQKAGIYGIKTQMLCQYGHYSNVLALESAKIARDLDPEMAEWWYLVGRSMGEIRKLLRWLECVDKEEIEALEKAVELHDSTSYLVLLAQTYSAAAVKASQKCRSQGDSKTKHDLGGYINSMNKKSLDLFMKVLDKGNPCVRTMTRCASGLLKLPGQYKRLQLAEQVVMKALKLAPKDAYAHRVAGLVYCYCPRDIEKVIKCYEKSSDLGNYKSFKDLLRLKNEINPTYDPYDDIVKFMEKYKKQHKFALTCKLGLYFLLKKRDIFKAIEFYTEVMEEDKFSLLKAKPVDFLSFDAPVNILKIAVDEVWLVLQNTESLSEENEKIITNFLREVSKIAPEVLGVEPEPGQVEKILERSRIRMEQKSKFRNSNNGRGKIGPNRAHNEQRENFHGIREWQDNKNEFRYRNKSGGTRNNKGYSWRDNDQEQRIDRGYARNFQGNYRERGNYNDGQRNWRSEGNNRTETNWRSRPNDNKES